MNMCQRRMLRDSSSKADEIRQQSMVGEMTDVCQFVHSLYDGIHYSLQDLLFWLKFIAKQKQSMNPTSSSQHLYIYYSVHVVVHTYSIFLWYC